MWLRDFLPEYVPGLRIMTYGYDSSLINPNTYSLADYRRNFIECLQEARRDCPVCGVIETSRVRELEMLTILVHPLETPPHSTWTQLGGYPDRTGTEASYIRHHYRV